MSRHGRIRQTRADTIYSLVVNVILAFVLTAVAYPMIYVLSASISDPEALLSGKVLLWPIGLSLQGYKVVFGYRDVWTGYYNTIIYTVSGTLISVAITILAAYPLSRKEFMLRGPIMVIFAFTMYFSGGLIPSYLLVRSLKMLNTRWAVILPGALGVYNVFMARVYYQSNIAEELVDAARIDGCTDFQFLWRVALPLSTAITAVLSLFYAVGQWNGWFGAFIYLSDPGKRPLQLILRGILIQTIIDPALLSPEDQAMIMYLQELLKYALIIVSTLPILILYPFLQRYFVKGIMLGSIKG